MKSPDLTQRPPRSPRVRLGGYTILPRVLDKARATLAGRAGDYKFGNPLDTVLFGFGGVDAQDFLAQAKTGAGDFEMLRWFDAKARKAPHEIAAWSAWTESFVDDDVETREWLAGRLRAMDGRRTDIHGIFDYLDLDDHLSFGGQA
ncbi:MAG: DUF5069 domain-containing protein [Verrucomicrobia bacterium]|nr:MAG: DUF5069 domain-containing protein [Verrucomicrobiota bacterium]